jgi:uncharacterized protein (UPF0332 family)
MSYPNDLLEQAWHLAQREPKRPKQASLRRAISTGYYALFHLLITETAKNWKRVDERTTVARLFEHTMMSKVCAKRRDDLTGFFKTRNIDDPEHAVEKHLLNIAETFGVMLGARHAADYDSSVEWTRRDAIELLESVQSAFASWDEIRETPLAQHFLVTLLLKDRRP